MKRLTAYVLLLALLLTGCGGSVDPDEAQESHANHHLWGVLSRRRLRL